ncbi:ABC transporter permease [Variovorax sp. Varisp62]|uniref:ABC transporter permease n=1 Tax=Variovorax sp. Varisp62 TaxID=3243049 RepID=UPI0039B4E00C
MSPAQNLLRRGRDIGLATVSIVLAWWFATLDERVPAYLLPTPVSVWQALEMMFANGDIWSHLGATLSVIFLGLIAGSLAGILGGAILASFDILRVWLNGTLLFLQIAPKIALAPLFLIWFGLGIASKVALVTSLVFFPVLIGTMLGIRSCDASLIDLARILRLSWMRALLTIFLPAAAADILAGVRVGCLQAVVGAVLAEWISSKSGLGHLMIRANSVFNTPLLFAAVVLTVLVGVLLYFMVESLEVRVLRHRI